MRCNGLTIQYERTIMDIENSVGQHWGVATGWLLNTFELPYKNQENKEKILFWACLGMSWLTCEVFLCLTQIKVYQHTKYQLKYSNIL